MGLSTFQMIKKMSSSAVRIDTIELNSEQIKAHQKTLLSMMDDIVNVCKENNINYFLGGGSALGAMRHQGFIPWDDDLDVNMPRADYERFIDLFQYRFGSKYWVHTPRKTHNYGLSMAKIRKKGTIMREWEDLDSQECGICIDIFIIENVFDNRLCRIVQGVVSLGLGYALSCRKFYHNRYVIRKLFADDVKVFNFKVFIGALLSFASLDWWCRLTDTWHSICKNSESKYVSGCAGRLHFFGEMYSRELFCKVKEVDFEGRKWNVPVDVEGYLRHCYKDWTRIPAEQDREKHLLFEYSNV